MWRSVFCSTMLSSSLVTGTEDKQEFMRGQDASCLLASPARLRAQPLHAEQNVNPEMLLASVQSVAHRLTASNEAPQEIFDEIGAIQAVLATMPPLLDEEHSLAEGQIQHQLEEIEACHSSAAHGTSVRDGLADELAVMTACMQATATAESAQQQECDEWNSHARLLAFPSTLESSSASPEVKFELYQTLKDWVGAQGPTIESQRTECNDATAFSVAESARCGPVIAEYDTMYCQHRLACTLLSACHQHESDVYQHLIIDTTPTMISRQNQYQVIVQVQCISDLITDALSANTTIAESSLDACDGEADVSHLTLTVPDPPAFSECPPPQESGPTCPEVQLPWAWDGGREVTTTTTTTTVADWVVSMTVNTDGSYGNARVSDALETREIQERVAEYIPTHMYFISDIPQDLIGGQLFVMGNNDKLVRAYPGHHAYAAGNYNHIQPHELHIHTNRPIMLYLTTPRAFTERRFCTREQRAQHNGGCLADNGFGEQEPPWGELIPDCMWTDYIHRMDCWRKEVQEDEVISVTRDWHGTVMARLL